MICTCSHGDDEHEEDYGPCLHYTVEDGPCLCVMFEEDDEEI